MITKKRKRNPRLRHGFNNEPTCEAYTPIRAASRDANKPKLGWWASTKYRTSRKQKVHPLTK